MKSIVPDLPFKNNKNEKSEYKFLSLFAMMFSLILIVCEMTIFLSIDFFQYKIPLPALIIPIIYSMCDIIAEVYGYHETKKIIWYGIFCQLIFGLFFTFITKVNFINFNENIVSLKIVFDNILRTSLACSFSVISGMFINAIAISKLKMNMNGKKYWVRTIISSCLSGFFGSFFACFFLFLGLKSYKEIFEIIVIILIYKFSFAFLIAFTLSFISNKLKKIENIDRYDYNVKYNPFKF